MARTARTHTHYVLLSTTNNTICTVRMYAVEVRQGRTSWTVGRVEGRPGSWNALGVGADAWTDTYSTRQEAVDAMLRGDTFQVTARRRAVAAYLEAEARAA